MTQLACIFLFCHTCPCFATLRHSFLLIPLQAVLLPTPTDAALCWASVLSFFNMHASMFLTFSKLCLSSISCLFFHFSCVFLRFFKSFLPATSFSVFLTIFLHFPRFSYLFPSVFRGPRENRTPPSPNCLVVHAPLKNWFWSTWATSTPHTP